MIRIRDFAEAVGCTPQNIYKHLKTYKKELEGHTEQSRRGLMLDDYACDFIRDVMYPKELSGDTQLLEEIERLKGQVWTAMQEAARLERENTKLQAQCEKLEEQQEKQQALLEESIEARTKVQKELYDMEVRACGAEAREQDLKKDKEFLADKVDHLKEELHGVTARNEAIMNRGLWARIVNKEV